MSIIPRTQTPVDCIDFVLYSPQPDHEFYLRIPIQWITDHFTKFTKFLLYLGWCILGALGEITDSQGQGVPSNAEQLQGGKTYFYGLDTDDIFKHAVDIEAIKARSRYNSSERNTPRNPGFVANLNIRDVACVFTGVRRANGIHIVPHRKESDWLQIIVSNRPNDEREEDLNDIDDIRNGMSAIDQINTSFDKKEAVIIKTPNLVLDMEDVSPRCARHILHNPLTDYPSGMRYTFQYLSNEDDQTTLQIMPDNNDAMFATTPASLALRKPSALLLNYNFGVAAVERWGHNKGILFKHLAAQRPEKETVAMGPSRVPGKEGRKSLAEKRKRNDDEQKQSRAGPSKAPKNSQQDDGSGEYDAEDIVLFFWANSKAARERRERTEENLRDSIEEWKSSVVLE